MKRLLACGFAMLSLARPAVAAEAPDVAFLHALFATPTIDASLFDVAFVQRVPVADVQTLVDGYRQRLGALQAVEHDATGDQLRFANGSLRATVELDEAGKAAGLRFHDEQSETDRAAIVRVLSSAHADSAWFTQAFLDQISISQIDALSAQVRAAEGSFVRVDSRAGVYYAVFANAENIVQIATSRSGKIAYLTLAPGTPKTPSP
jgi:hypothetical protein